MRDGSLQSIPQSASQPRLPRIMEASVEPQPRGPDWMPITPKTGSLFHADSHLRLARGCRHNEATARLAGSSGFSPASYGCHVAALPSVPAELCDQIHGTLPVGFLASSTAYDSRCSRTL